MKKIILLATVITAITFSSCSKEQGCTDSEATNFSITAEENDGSCLYTVKGCTDSDSETYNSLATEDDGSCEYEGSFVIWTAEIGAGQSANVYLNGILQGNIAISFSTAPDCGQTGALTITKDLGSNTEGSYLLTVDVISEGVLIENAYSATLIFEANTCSSIEL